MKTTKKYLLTTMLLAPLMAIILSGCGKEPAMDVLLPEGYYRYENKDLGFALALPPEFEYFQTQRTEQGERIDLEIFVPTADRAYPQFVPGYGRPLLIEVFEASAWAAVKGEEQYSEPGLPVFEKDGRAYVLLFWETLPADWQSKWTDEMRDGIKTGFRLL